MKKYWRLLLLLVLFCQQSDADNEYQAVTVTDIQPLDDAQSRSENTKSEKTDNTVVMNDLLNNHWDKVKKSVAQKISHDCQLFWYELRIAKSPYFHFEHCQYDDGDQGTPLVIYASINGVDALSAEKWLIDNYKIIPLERLVGGWGSDSLFDHFNHEKEITLRIIISSTERPDILERKDWHKINRFDIKFIKYSADAW